MGEGDREDVRLFFEDRAQAREKFRANALAWISGQGGAEALLERWGDLAETGHGVEANRCYQACQWLKQA